MLLEYQYLKLRASRYPSHCFAAGPSRSQAHGRPWFFLPTTLFSYTHLAELSAYSILSYINDRDSMPAKLYMLIVVVLDGGNGVQVLAYKVAQYAVTGAVKDAHAAHTD